MDSGSPQRFDACVNNLAILADILQVCCVELIRDYGVHEGPQDCPSASESSEACSSASIEFGGPHLSGCLTLVAAQRIIAGTAPALPERANVEPDALADWTCELANQLLGRLKNRLLGYQLSLDMGLPRLLPSTASDPPSHDACHRIVCEQGVFSGYLRVRIEPGITLLECASLEPLASEGEFLLF